MTKIGVLGGMGPAATARFYQHLIEIAQQKYNAVQDNEFPEIIISSCGLDGFDETGITHPERVLQQLLAGIDFLTKAGASFIVIPCNTVHCFIEQIRAHSNAPVLSIVEETVAKVKNDGFTHVGLLCSETTYNTQLYDQALTQHFIEVILPSNKNTVTQLIVEIMGGTVSEKTKEKVLQLIEAMPVEGIILGCTELPLAITQSDSKVKVYDSLSILAEAAVDYYYTLKSTPLQETDVTHFNS